MTVVLFVLVMRFFFGKLGRAGFLDGFVSNVFDWGGLLDYGFKNGMVVYPAVFERGGYDSEGVTYLMGFNCLVEGHVSFKVYVRPRIVSFHQAFIHGP